MVVNSVARSSCARQTSSPAGPARPLVQAPARACTLARPQPLQPAALKRLPSLASSKWAGIPLSEVERWGALGAGQDQTRYSGSWSFHQVPVSGMWLLILSRGVTAVGTALSSDPAQKACLSLWARERTPRGAAICLRGRITPSGWSSPVARAAAGHLA